MFLSTLGATGMGSMLKILGGAVQSRNEAKEAEAKRELIRDLQMKQADIKASYHAIVEILSTLSGNGLKEKFGNKKRERDY